MSKRVINIYGQRAFTNATLHGSPDLMSICLHVHYWVSAKVEHILSISVFLCCLSCLPYLADLIMLGLATHEPNFTIIREEFKPNKPRPCALCGQVGHEIKDCEGLAREKQGQVSVAQAPSDSRCSRSDYLPTVLIKHLCSLFLTAA